MVNAYKAVARVQSLNLIDVPTPQAVQNLTYAGVAQVGVAKTEAYTLSTVRKGESETSARDDALETNVGEYVTTVHLRAGYQWADGTTVDKTLEWHIAPATLTVTCPGATVRRGDALPSDITVEGFVNGETQETAAGYRSPTMDYGGAANESNRAVLPADEDMHEFECTASGG